MVDAADRQTLKRARRVLDHALADHHRRTDELVVAAALVVDAAQGGGGRT